MKVKSFANSNIEIIDSRLHVNEKLIFILSAKGSQTPRSRNHNIKFTNARIHDRKPHEKAIGSHHKDPC